MSDLRIIRTLSVDTRVTTYSVGVSRVETAGTTYTPETIAERARSLDGWMDLELGGRYCLLSRVKMDGGRKEEHIILQGLGTKWIKLPPGFVADEVNQSLSACELAFQRYGMMGVLRPFYVGATKRAEFRSASGTSVTFENAPDLGFRIVLRGGCELVLDSQSDRLDNGLAEGALNLRIDAEFPPARHVSRALHKMALLAFSLHAGGMGFADDFIPCREFILRDSAPYRPFIEEFIPGAAPGFDITFHVFADEKEDGHRELREVAATIRLHHMRYVVCLAGSSLVGQSGVVLEDAPTGKRKVGVTFGFDRIVPKHA